MKDITSLENFLNSYFGHQDSLVFLKVHTISKKHSKSHKFYKFLKYKIKLLNKEKVSNLDLNNLYTEHFWFLKTIDLFSKIFRDIKKYYKIEKRTIVIFKEKINSLKNEIIKKTSLDFLQGRYEEVENFIKMNNYYKLNFKEEVENRVIEMFVENVIEKDLLELKLSLENINYDLFDIKDRIYLEISSRINYERVLECLQNKQNLNFLSSLFVNNKQRYKELIIVYLDSLNTPFNDKYIFVENILKIYQESKFFDNFIRSVVDTWLKNLNLQYKIFIDILNESKIQTPDFYEFCGILFNFITEKDAYEKELRRSLCYRLFNNKKTIKEEECFINIYKTYAKDIYVYKMEDVLEDFKKRHVFYNSEILMMRRFQWAEFENVKVDIPELNELKKKYENEIAKYERKKIYWMDSLSSVELEIYDKTVILNLIQYDIIVNLNQNIIDSLEYKKNLQVLLDNNLLFYKDGTYSISKDFTCTNFNILKHSLLEDKLIINNNVKKFINEVVDSKIMAKLKKYKTLNINELLEISNKVEVYDRLKVLEKKGYCKISDKEITYCP